VVWTLVAIHLPGAVIGYLYWYGDLILRAPWWGVPFVPDSPLSATLMAAALLSLHYRRSSMLLPLLAVTGSIKYGLWAPWFWLINYAANGEFHFEAATMTAVHLGMAAEAVALIPLLSFRLRDVALVALWYGFNDLHDYAIGQLPRVPNPEDIALIAGFAVASTVVLVLLWLGLALNGRRGRAAPAPGQRAAGCD
jgi:uncharacterized membrane protein YpjA